MSDEKLVAYLIDRVESIDKKVDLLLEFKWKIIGGALAISFVSTVVIQVIIKNLF